MLTIEPFVLPCWFTLQTFSLPDGAEEVVLETDAVAFQHITLAIRDTVIDEAAGLGAERVLLVLAYPNGVLGSSAGSFWKPKAATVVISWTVAIVDISPRTQFTIRCAAPFLFGRSFIT